MPYRNKEKKKEYQRNRYKKIRQEWIKNNGPCKKCKSQHNLEVDHIDPSNKISHRIWSWSENRRNAELAKCQVLCKKCHANKSLTENGGKSKHGTANARRNGCSCELCKKYHREYMRKYRLIRR